MRALHDTGKLKPVKKSPDGAYLFDQCDLDRVVDTYKKEARKTKDEGSIAASVFRLLDAGTTIRQLVIETEQPPAVIRDLVRAYVDAGDAVIIEAGMRRRCEALLSGHCDLDWQKPDETFAELLRFKVACLSAQLTA
jgi:hypothetical protein